MNLYAYVEGNPINFMDPFGLHKQDKWYGYNDKDFHKWFHRCYKEKGDPPQASKETIVDAYQEWKASGSPKGGKCGGPPPGEPESEEICGETCQKIVIGVTITGGLIIEYICTGGPFNPVYN